MKITRTIGRDVTVKADERSLSNLNTLVIGATGTGKTRGYVSPNISAADTESMVIIDSKLNLYKKHMRELKNKGYRVELIDLCCTSNSSVGYNPLDMIRKDQKSKTVRTDDINELADWICSDDEFHDSNDPFWQLASRQYISACIHLCFHILPDDEHDLTIVGKLLNLMNQPEWSELINEAELNDPEAFEVLFDRTVRTTRKAERMHASISGIAGTAMALYTWDDCDKLYSAPVRFNPASLGDTKTALFINVPDHDHSKTPIVRLFFSQCIKVLLDHADSCPKSRLKIPVHLYCDDIGASFVIPHLPELLSITRSRGISVSLILQNWGQLEAKYGSHSASTIAGNCSIAAYLGGTDIETPRYFSEKANMPLDKITGMPLNYELVLIQGQKPFFTRKHNADDYRPVEYSPEKHEHERSNDYGKEAS